VLCVAEVLHDCLCVCVGVRLDYMCVCVCAPALLRGRTGVCADDSVRALRLAVAARSLALFVRVACVGVFTRLSVASMFAPQTRVVVRDRKRLLAFDSPARVGWT
jgi:hypothetical protein